MVTHATEKKIGYFISRESRLRFPRTVERRTEVDSKRVSAAFSVCL